MEPNVATTAPARRGRPRKPAPPPPDPARLEAALEIARSLEPGSLVFVEYVAASAAHPSPAALRSVAAGFPQSYYVGTYLGYHLTAAGHVVLRLEVINRGGERRAINPLKGDLRAVRVIHPAPPPDAMPIAS